MEEGVCVTSCEGGSVRRRRSRGWGGWGLSQACLPTPHLPSCPYPPLPSGNISQGDSIFRGTGGSGETARRVDRERWDCWLLLLSALYPAYKVCLSLFFWYFGLCLFLKCCLLHPFSDAFSPSQGWPHQKDIEHSSLNLAQFPTQSQVQVFSSLGCVVSRCMIIWLSTSVLKIVFKTWIVLSIRCLVT